MDVQREKMEGIQCGELWIGKEEAEYSSAMTYEMSSEKCQNLRCHNS